MLRKGPIGSVQIKCLLHHHQATSGRETSARDQVMVLHVRSIVLTFTLRGITEIITLEILGTSKRYKVP